MNKNKPILHLCSALLYSSVVALAFFDLKMAFIAMASFKVVACILRFIVDVAKPEVDH